MSDASVITLLGKKHKGKYKGSFVDGVVFLLLRVYYNKTDKDIKKMISVKGKGIKLDLNVVEEYGVGPHEGDEDIEDVHDKHSFNAYMLQNLEWIEDASELEEIGLGKYLAEVYIDKQEEGGYERDLSFVDICTFNDLDFARGLISCNEWLGGSNGISPILDTDTFKFVSL